MGSCGLSLLIPRLRVVDQHNHHFQLRGGVARGICRGGSGRQSPPKPKSLRSASGRRQSRLHNFAVTFPSLFVQGEFLASILSDVGPDTLQERLLWLHSVRVFRTRSCACVVLRSPSLGPLVGLGRLDAVFVRGASSHNHTALPRCFRCAVFLHVSLKLGRRFRTAVQSTQG